LGKYERKSVKPAVISDRASADEYGEDEKEQANYGQFEVVAERYKDSTGAYAASLAMAQHALQVGNYLITCTGNCPKDLAALVEKLPKMSHAALPVLRDYFPAKNMVPRSERYILGPVGLRAAAPQIPEAAAAFQFGTEGEIARYRTPHGEAILAIFSYPTLELARQQAAVLEKLPDAVVKRTGFMVAVVLAPGNQAAADQLLAQINYQASVSWDEQKTPLVIRPQTAAQMILGIIALAGIVLGFCLFSGLAFGALRVVARRFGYSDARIALTTLHLSDK
jgi:hypothetical protein